MDMGVSMYGAPTENGRAIASSCKAIEDPSISPHVVINLQAFFDRMRARRHLSTSTSNRCRASSTNAQCSHWQSGIDFALQGDACTGAVGMTQVFAAERQLSFSKMPYLRSSLGRVFSKR